MAAATASSSASTLTEQQLVFALKWCDHDLSNSDNFSVAVQAQIVFNNLEGSLTLNTTAAATLPGDCVSLSATSSALSGDVTFTSVFVRVSAASGPAAAPTLRNFYVQPWSAIFMTSSHVASNPGTLVLLQVRARCGRLCLV